MSPHRLPPSGSCRHLHRIVACCGITTLVLSSLISACGGGGGDNLAPTSYDVSGNWNFEEALGDAAVGVSCDDTGDVVVTQNGSRFSATGNQSGQCSGPGGTVPFSGPFSITNGRINGDQISFKVDPCPYQGTAYGTAPDSVLGTINCTLTQQNVTLHLVGTWALRRP